MAMRAAASAALVGRGRNPTLVSLCSSLLRTRTSSTASASSLHGRTSFPHQNQGDLCRKPFTISKYVPIRAINTETSAAEPKNLVEENDKLPQSWKVKMLYDGDCPLCLKEVNMLRERNKQYETIKFVDISSDDYSPQENQDIDYKTAMGRIHAILSDGTVVTDVEAFRRLYEAVGLGWIYAVTKYKPVEAVVNVAYAVWAKYRMQITGRPPLEDILEERRKKMGAVCKDNNTCKM